jgi:hypothetical protein
MDGILWEVNRGDRQKNEKSKKKRNKWIGK